MKLHYYGLLDSLESSFTFQEFVVDGVSIYLQKSPRFGFDARNIIIKDPAVFIHSDKGYYRFVLEDKKIEVNADGDVVVSESFLKNCIEMAKNVVPLD
jgi:hypothetical protein